MINDCDNVICENNGICRPIFQNFTCECLGDSFYGQYCEYCSTKQTILRTASRSIAYIVIIFLVCTAVYIIIMDVLKYFFGIDLAKNKSKLKTKRHQPVIERFIYIVD